MASAAKRTEISVPFLLSGLSVKTAKSPCPGKQLPTSGGFEIDDSDIEVVIRDLFPDGKRFAVELFNPSASATTGSVIALCSKPKNIRVVERTKRTGDDVEAAQADAKCPRGSRLIGGGGAAAQSGRLVFSGPAGGNRWAARFDLPAGTNNKITSYAVCDSAANKVEIVQESDTITGRRRGNEGSGHAVAECPAGTKLVGGGHAKVEPNPAFVFDYDFSRPSGNGWEVSGYGHEGNLFAYALCEKQ